MNKIKIGLVEDEVIIADDLKALLEEIGYNCADPCGSYDEAIEMLAAYKPDLAILDINLGDQRDGIDVAKHIRASLDIPFIFLTANSDSATVARAKATLPNAYLVKPFQKGDLYTAIEIALYNFNQGRVAAAAAAPAQKKIAPNSLFIKDGSYFHKVNFDEILYLSTEHVYIVVVTTQRNFLVRASLSDYLENFDPARFVRTHRSCAVNIEKVDKINTSGITVGNVELPLSQNYRDSLLKALNVG